VDAEPPLCAELILDEAEKTLLQVEPDLIHAYADLVDNPMDREAILALIETELARTIETILRVTGARTIAERFPHLRERIDRRRAMLDRVGHEQIQLLRLVRDPATEADQRSAAFSALLFSINCVAAGFGTTG
jgi:phosphoenolpyruvate carboxylase